MVDPHWNIFDKRTGPDTGSGSLLLYGILLFPKAGDLRIQFQGLVEKLDGPGRCRK